MGKQPKYPPQAANPVFADGRAMRPPVEHTVARGELAADERYYKGIAGEAWVKQIPVPVTAKLMSRGQERYNTKPIVK